MKIPVITRRDKRSCHEWVCPIMAFLDLEPNHSRRQMYKAMLKQPAKRARRKQ